MKQNMSTGLILGQLAMGMANSANQPIPVKKGGMARRFLNKSLDGRALLGQPLKGCQWRISILFLQCSTTLLAPHIKKLETYFALLYFWTFAQCAEIELS